jgi:hypothetical protein
MINEAFGWLWVTVGFASGAAIGVRFHDPQWLGGYGALPRRLIRLGHISLIALGALNILFAQSVDRLQTTGGEVATASWLFIFGAVAMPACCALTAWRPGIKPLFIVPVVCLTAAGALAFYAMVRP